MCIVQKSLKNDRFVEAVLFDINEFFFRHSLNIAFFNFFFFSEGKRRINENIYHDLRFKDNGHLFDIKGTPFVSKFGSKEENVMILIVQFYLILATKDLNSWGSKVTDYEQKLTAPCVIENKVV